jgi:SAM-dependent methyltransferase
MHNFQRQDIGDEHATLPVDMEVVTAMSVLLHITDDVRFERALRRLLRCLRPDGTLVLVEPVVVHRWWGPPFGRHANSKARPLKAYTRILREEGFALVDLRPSSCLLTNVIDTRSRLAFRALELYWELLSRAVGRRERLGKLVALPLRELDRVMSRTLPHGPSSKVIVARRVTSKTLRSA